MAKKELIQESQTESQAGFQKTFTATYLVPINASLSDVSLEEGDTYPEDSTFEIIQATLKPNKNSNRRTVTKIATIVAWKHRTE